MKELSEQGLGIIRKQASVISISQQNELWECGYLGSDTLQKLLDTVLYLLGLHFALRAGEEHRKLRLGENSKIVIKNDEEGRRYLEYIEDVSKSNRGGLLHRKVNPKVTIAYEDTEQPERCPVNIYCKVRVRVY